MIDLNQDTIDFDKRHGLAIISEDEAAGWYLFPDGAIRERSYRGMMYDAPADPHERAKRIARYWRIVYERRLKSFDDRKKTMRYDIQNANRAGLPVFDADLKFSELEKVRDAVRAAKKCLDAAEQQVTATIPAEVIRDRKLAEHAQFQNLQHDVRLGRIEL